MSYAAEVIADNSGKWVKNLLRFADPVEAAAYGEDLKTRWTLVRLVRVTQTADPVNARWVEHHVQHLARRTT